MIKFDTQIQAQWSNKNITRVSIEFIPSGCEGTSITIHENTILSRYILLEILPSGTEIYIDPIYQETMKDAYLTWTGKNWILNSESILTRCGCGKSFGIKTGNLKIDTLKILKSKLSKKQSTHHSKSPV